LTVDIVLLGLLFGPHYYIFYSARDPSEIKRLISAFETSRQRYQNEVSITILESMTSIIPVGLLENQFCTFCVTNKSET